MSAEKRPKVILPASQANTDDAEVLSDLLAQHPALRQVDCLQRFSGGYSGCRVYLVQPTFSSPAPRPWILKLGPTSEIRAESAGLAVAEGFVSPDNIAGKIAEYYNENTGVLVQQFGNYYGRRALDLDAALEGVYAVEAFKTVVQTLEGWISKPVWKTDVLTTKLKSWILPKLANLPASILETADVPVIYSPDYGEAYANPLYYLRRDLKRLEISCPFAFTHGDLNLRNVLFSRNADNSLDTTKPVFIDFRHAGDTQWAINDLAKLEACLRFTYLALPDDYGSLQQRTAFLASTRQSLMLSPLPAICSNKAVQDVWRCLEFVRGAVRRIIAQDLPAEVAYWACLSSYAISAATYPQLSRPEAHLAYLDAAAILSNRVIERSPTGEQYALPVHATYSPPVRGPTSPPPATSSRLSLLRSSIAKGRSILILGPGYGRSGGVEPYQAFVQRLFHELTGEPAPLASSRIVLEALSKRRSRPDILKAMQQRLKACGQDPDTSFLRPSWAGLVNFHFHDLPAQILATEGHEVKRIDSLEDALQHTDDITAGNTFYLPLHGDIWSKPDNLVITNANSREREEIIQSVAKALAARQVPLTVVFWRCEELSIEDIASIRDQIVEQLTVSAECYFLTEQNNNARDATLATLEVIRVDDSLKRFLDPIPSDTIRSVGDETSKTWLTSTGEQRRLPNLFALTNGLLGYFEGSLSLTSVDRSRDSDFLRGAPPTTEDIDAGRVVQRAVVRSSLLPAIKGAIFESEKSPYAIVVTGRAGSGITTLLCCCAYELARETRHPILITDTQRARGRKEWLEAGPVIADISKATDSTVIVFVDAHEKSLDDVTLLVQGVIEHGGSVLPVIGGRRETLQPALREFNTGLFAHRYEVHDGLTSAEWEALARVLQHHGFSTAITEKELIKRLEAVGRLIPAIYEATDHDNRKFREIISYEYECYGRDQLVQKAYRIICSLGAFGVPLTQFWLLKALGGRVFNDAQRILGALSEDLIVQRDVVHKDGDVQIAPRHRVIAEEIVSIASPDPRERVVDLEALIATANLGSLEQGMAIAKLLYHRGPLALWAREAFPSEAEQQEKISKLIETALDNNPHHPQVELHLRQHYALQHRNWRNYDDALTQAKIAYDIDPDNAATDHIMGLIHESRAIRAWKDYSVSQNPHALARARSDERDAVDFFESVRERRPFQEHGYESEARYYRKKREALRNDTLPIEITDEARFNVFQGLSLLTAAEHRVPPEAIRESRKTRAYLERLAGDLDRALKTLLAERERCEDAIRKRRITRVAAVLAAEAAQLDTAARLYDWLIAEGDRDAAVYLARDEVLRKNNIDVRDRAFAFQDSAEQFNRWDVETLVRWAELLSRQRKFNEALHALTRADQNAQGSYSIFERERIRGSLDEAGKLVRFEGKVERFFRQREGFISCSQIERPVFFRANHDLAANLTIDASVSFALAWRIRGFRAINVETA
jgi:hypothetical protein